MVCEKLMLKVFENQQKNYKCRGALHKPEMFLAYVIISLACFGLFADSLPDLKLQRYIPFFSNLEAKFFFSHDV